MDGKEYMCRPCHMTKTLIRQMTGSGVSMLLLGLALTGCGAQSSSAPTGKSAKPLPTVVIGKAVDTIPFTVVNVAQAEHFFQKNGVKVKDELLNGSSQANAALVGGSLQFVCEAANPLLLARSKGIPLISIDALDRGVTLQLAVSNKWLKAHPVPKNASLKTKMSDLNGAIYGEVSTTDLSDFELLRRMAGLPATSGYQVDEVGNEAEDAVEVEKGTIDAFMVSPPSSMQVFDQGYAREFVDRYDIPSWKNTAYDIFVTTSTYAKAHPNITRDVATAVAESLNFMIAHPHQTLAIEEHHFPSINARILKQSVAFIPFASNGLQSQARWNNAVQMARETGFIKGNVVAPQNQAWTNQYIDLAKLKQ